MRALIGLGAGALVLTLILRGKPMATADRPDNIELRYFEPEEFGEWWPLMSRELLQKLDEYRRLWGAPVIVSPAAGAIGRHQGPDGTSQHNVDAWGEIRAIDVFPQVPAGGAGYRYMHTREQRARARRIAREVGFTGIGLYTDTAPGDMLHVDVRPGNHVAEWSRVDGDYLDIGMVA